MDDIKLENLIPSPSTFDLEKFPDMTFNLKPCTGEKYIEMAKELGDLESVIATPSAENISKLAMILMSPDSAEKLKEQKVRVIDINGKVKKIKMGGYILLMYLITSIDEQYKIYGAVLKAFGYSEKITKEIIKELTIEVKESLKKKTQKRQCVV